MSIMRAIDLFCGTGGFSRGAHEAGFQVTAAYDVDPILTSSYGANFPKTELCLKDIASLSAKAVRKAAGGEIDLIFGGPPCQGFSVMGRQNKVDPRRRLLQHFFRLVAELRPGAFVMENVLGLGYIEARSELDEALALLPQDYTIIGPVVLDASDFGAATKRKRLFVIGFDRRRCSPIGLDDILSAKAAATTVADALSGLESARALDVNSEFDTWEMAEEANLSAYAKSLVAKDRRFTGNMRTIHTDRVLARFSTVKPGTLDKIGRHPRLSWTGQCPTLRAGTGADVGSYQSVRPIHPSENRVITVREAARLQGFPDNHRFHPSIWHSFRMIGNSVSPVIAKAILSVIAEKLAQFAERKRAA